MHDKISVIMSTKDTPKEFLDASINSILTQTYNNIEFIIICDGSEEDYNYISSSYNDKRMKLFLNKTNKGLAFSLNEAVQKSTGTYIARMDSDDISLPNRLEKELAYLKRYRLDVCGTSAYYFGNKKGKKRLLFNSSSDLKTQLLFRSVLIHPSVLGKRSFFRKNHYNEEYLCSQDYELWARVSDKSKMGVLDKCLLKYRMHNNQISVAKKEMQRKLAKEIIKTNAAKITNKYDEKIFECLWFLSGREKITNNNYRRLSSLIDYTLEKNSIFRNYDKKSMKKVFYNRFFEEVIKNGVIVGDLSSMNKILRFYNFIDLIFYYLNKK